MAEERRLVEMTTTALAPRKRACIVCISRSDFEALGREQQAAFVAIVQLRYRTFLTGKAGSGKSHLLQLIRRCFPEQSTFFTGSTGLAAVGVSGMTLHSFAGIGLGDGSVEELLYIIRSKQDTMARWLDCEILVIDEVSMIDGELLEKLEHIARVLRNDNRIFGGIQVILTGDLLQLPPVKVKTPLVRTDVWKRIVEVEVLMESNFRQKDDPVFLQILDDMRVGRMTVEACETLAATGTQPLAPVHGVIPTRLFPHRNDAERANQKMLAELTTPSVMFEASDWKKGPRQQSFAKHCPVPMKVELKRGCQVMLLKNLDTTRGLCNGRRGMVIEFVLVASNSSAQIEPNLIDEDCHAMYDEIGLSHVPCVSTLNISMLERSLIGITTRDVLGGTCGKLGADVRILPRVLFENGVTTVIDVARFDSTELRSLKALRYQIPLILAYSGSIHKCQGLTLDQAEIDAARMFEEGQLYVAVSRVRTLAGLRLLNLEPRALHFSADMVAFYNDLTKRTRHTVTTLLASMSLTFDGPPPPKPEQWSFSSNSVDFIESDVEDDACLSRASTTQL